MSISALKIERIGPIRAAEVAFGDLTVLVGPQATGKSIFLQFLKLVADVGYVHDQLRKHGIDWKRSLADFLDVYLGAGMSGVWHEGELGSAVSANKAVIEIGELVTVRKRKTNPTLFYIPAQRVLSLANGWPRPFQAFAAEDPFAVRDFSETFRLLMEQDFSPTADLFPKTNRLKKEYRDILSEHVFGRFGLYVERYGAQKRLVLRAETSHKSIPFMAWSAGQREFVPLLMGLYWLMPAARTQRRAELEWVVIEEPEMGLHPNAISAVILLVLDLLWRGYRVCLSTHSPHVLDVVWALRTIQEPSVNKKRQTSKEQKFLPDFILKMFEVRKTDPLRKVAQAVLEKSMRVYYFTPDGHAKDISDLDPCASPRWGGLIEFSGRVNEIVAQVMGNSTRISADAKSRKKAHAGIESPSGETDGNSDLLGAHV
ncbi:MAG: ATP-binding protein [Candidatus Sumerlaeia bacterium]|nr:ATP-binding protein [Candidatus Sumerlaeia bacterium]